MKLNANDRKQIKDFIKEKRCYFLKKNNPFSNIKVTNEGKIEFFVKTNPTLNYYKSGFTDPWCIHEKPQTIHHVPPVPNINNIYI